MSLFEAQSWRNRSGIVGCRGLRGRVFSRHERGRGCPFEFGERRFERLGRRVGTGSEKSNTGTLTRKVDICWKSFPNMKGVLDRCSHSHCKRGLGIWNPCSLDRIPLGIERVRSR